MNSLKCAGCNTVIPFAQLLLTPGTVAYCPECAEKRTGIHLDKRSERGYQLSFMQIGGPQ